MNTFTDAINALGDESTRLEGSKEYADRNKGESLYRAKAYLQTLAPEPHDASLEPSDDAIAALQHAVARQRMSVKREPSVEPTAKSEEYLERAARNMRVFEALRRVGR